MRATARRSRSGHFVASWSRAILSQGAAALAAAGVAVLLASCAGRQPVGEELAASRTRTEVLARLRADPDTSPYEIGVELDSGVVRLSGEVAADAERVEAERIAAAVEGVREVVNDLRLAPAAAPAGEPPLDDESLRARLVAKLAAHPQLAELRLDVQVHSGAVTLDGQVGSEGERRAAEGIVRSTAGVRAVENLLTIVPSPDG